MNEWCERIGERTSDWPSTRRFYSDSPLFSQVVVTDVEPATFKAMVAYCYTGNLPAMSFPSLAQLIAAADRYGLTELKDRCDWAICALLKVDNVVEALLIADIHDCQGLREDGIALFKAHSEEVKRNMTMELEQRLKQRPSLLFQLIA